MTTRSQNLMSTCFLGLLLSACGDSPASSGELEPDAGHHHDAGDHDAAEHEGGTDYVPCDPKLAPLAAGTEVVGEKLTIKVLSVTPLPLLKGSSDWEVELRSQAGELVTDLAVTRAWTFMPVHSHPGNFEPKFEALSEPGHYAFKGFNFTMRGPWQVRFDLASEAAGNEFLVFDVCVEPE